MRLAIAISAAIALLYASGYVAMRGGWTRTSRFTIFGDGVDRGR